MIRLSYEVGGYISFSVEKFHTQSETALKAYVCVHTSAILNSKDIYILRNTDSISKENLFF